MIIEQCLARKSHGKLLCIYHTMKQGITQTFTEHLKLGHNFAKLLL